MLNNKRLEITGAAGSLGQAAAKVAHQQCAEVIGLDIAATADIPGGNYKKVDLLDN